MISGNAPEVSISRGFSLSGAILCTILAMTLSGFSTAAPEVRSAGVGLSGVITPSAFDVDGDGKWEILLADSHGAMAVVDSVTLEPWWKRQVSKKSLQPPVIGDFLGTGAPILATTGADGAVRFLWPGTGDSIAHTEGGPSVSLPCSIVHLPGKKRDGLVICDNDGNVRMVTLDDSMNISTEFVAPNSVSGSGSITVLGRLSLPATCADLTGDGSPEIIVASESSVIQVIPVNAPQSRFFYSLPQGISVHSVMACAPFFRDGFPGLLVGVGADLYVLKAEKKPDGTWRLNASLQATAFGQTLGQMLFLPVNGDPSLDLVASAENAISSYYLGSGMSGGDQLIPASAQQLASVFPPFSPALPYLDSKSQVSILTIDKRGSAFFWRPTESGETLKGVPGFPVLDTVVPCGNLTGSGFLEIACFDSEKNKLEIVKTNQPVSPESPVVMTAGVTFDRAGEWSPRLMALWNDRKVRAKAAFDAASTALEKSLTSGDTAARSRWAAAMAGMRPHDEQARAVYRKYVASGSGFSHAAAIVVGILTLVFLFLIIAVVTRQKKRG